MITLPLMILLPEDCRCFANLRPNTNTDLISNSTQNLTATGSRLCILKFNHLSSAVFGPIVMVRSLWRISLWSKDVGPLFSFLGPADDSLFLCALDVFFNRFELQSVLHSPRKKKGYFQRKFIFHPWTSSR